MLFKGQSGTTSHVLAAITNGSTGNNTFGMTFGTNGCSTKGTLTYGGKEMIDVSMIMDEFSEGVARPGLKLVEHLPVTTIPLDTMRVVESEGLVSEVFYRES